MKKFEIIEIYGLSDEPDIHVLRCPECNMRFTHVASTSKVACIRCECEGVDPVNEIDVELTLDIGENDL